MVSKAASPKTFLGLLMDVFLKKFKKTGINAFESDRDLSSFGESLLL
jgi:hypothetical protein